MPLSPRICAAALTCALFVTFAFLFCTLTASGCGLLRDGGGTPDSPSPGGIPTADPGAPISWPDVLDCGPDVDDVVSAISTILLGSEREGDEATQVEVGKSAIADLEKLARDYGPSTVACLVDLLQREWTRPGGSASPERFAAAQRAGSFLEHEHVKVTSNAAYVP